MRRLHDWNLSYRQAIDLQKSLAGKVKLTSIRKKPALIAGIDCALSEDGQRIIAAVVVLSTQTSQKSLWGTAETCGFEIVETTNAVRKLTFPYIPGLLSFREAPVCIDAVEKLRTWPDVFIIDGQGIAHPRRLGLAAHLGLWLDTPTIGCAKSRLVGSYEEPPGRKGAFSYLTDSGETIGAVVRTRTDVKPLFISVGHKCRLDDAIKWTLNCAVKYRLPEPTRLADIEVGKIKKKM